MPELLTDWVDYHACVRPDEVAVASTEPDAHVPQLTWRQLDDRVGRLARVLLDHGVRRGDRVGLVAENDPRIFELQFACMRIGAIMVPLNWRLAVPELRGMLADAAPACFLHDLAWAELAAQLGTGLDLGPVLAWGDETSSYEQALAASSDPLRGGELDPGATVQILYTSGTTGLPKGVICTNRTIVAQAENLAHSSRMAERGGHHLNIVPLFHAGGLNVFTNAMLFWGGRVTTVGRFEPRTVLRLLNDPGLAITHLCGVLQMFEWMTALPEFPESAFLTLHTVLFGGWGPSAAGIYRAWAARGIWMQLSYGASELGPNVSVLSRPDPGAAERGSSGTILPHTRVRLVDAGGREVSAGETGEILVRGPGVVPGYWRQDPAPFFLDGWFRTGDAGRMDEAGHLYIVGRVKEVYRSGGENVYPAEVEQTLADMPGITEFAVLGVPDERWGETGLIAVIPEPGVTITLEAVREYAGPRLARFKLPSYLLVMTELPRSATDKISRSAIREIWQRGRQATSDGAKDQISRPGRGQSVASRS
jgi:fatty-acyl-CoA synthase